MDGQIFMNHEFFQQVERGKELHNSLKFNYNRTFERSTTAFVKWHVFLLVFTVGLYVP